MARFGVTSILLLIFAMSALAAEMPSRKPGLWEIKLTMQNLNTPGQVMQQCVDASTDQLMQSNVGPNSQRQCSKRDVQRSGDSITIDSTCTVRGKTMTSRAVVTGSFDSAYTMTVTSQSEGAPGGGVNMTMTAKWLGPCTADQKPGDVIMAGRKFNILDARNRGAAPGAQPPPQ